MAPVLWRSGPGPAGVGELSTRQAGQRGEDEADTESTPTAVSGSIMRIQLQEILHDDFQEGWEGRLQRAGPQLHVLPMCAIVLRKLHCFIHVNLS